MILGYLMNEGNDIGDTFGFGVTVGHMAFRENFPGEDRGRNKPALGHGEDADPIIWSVRKEIGFKF